MSTSCEDTSVVGKALEDYIVTKLNRAFMTLNICRKIHSIARRQFTSNHWHSVLVDPASAALLYQGDGNTEELQRNLHALSHSGVSFASSITFFTGRIYTTDDYDLVLSCIRTVLEIFILYSMSTSSLDWCKRAPDLSRGIESLSSLRFQKSRLPRAVDHPTSMRHCLRASAHSKMLSRLEKHRAEIIEAISDLSEKIPQDLPLVLYDDYIPQHRENAAEFLRKLKTTGQYWTAMAYCLAIEPANTSAQQGR